METLVYAKLAAETGLTSILSTRIYPVQPTTDTLLPLLVFTRVTTEDFLNIAGTSSLHKYEYIFDYWAINLDTCLSIASALYTCLQGWKDSNVQGAFRQNTLVLEEEFENGTVFHGQSTFTIFG